MKWKQIDLFVPEEATELVALLLCECGSNGSITDEEKSHDGYTCITAYFPDEQANITDILKKKLADMEKRHVLCGPWNVSEQTAEDTSWLYAWQKYFHPKKISSRFWVEPAWEAAPANSDDLVITVDPGLAFGSGLHDTTSLCVSYLEETVQDGDRVIDIGTGTGILAIAAAKLGAAHVTAVDLDEKAVVQAVVNVDLNDVAQQVSVSCSDLLAQVATNATKADVIVANIVSDAIIALLPVLPEYMKAGAVFIASGIIDDRIEDIRVAAKDNGFTWIDERLRNGWYAVRMRWLP
jgi:ribosomal protein L11 methyltransferase